MSFEIATTSSIKVFSYHNIMCIFFKPDSTVLIRFNIFQELKFNDVSGGLILDELSLLHIEKVSKATGKETVTLELFDFIDLSGILGFCFYCEKTTSNLKRCSRCHRVYYCSTECQRSDWSQHKVICLLPSV